MKADFLEMNMLYDFYGGVLTEKQRDYFDLYYCRDLSLGEIAEEDGISRQGVLDTVSRAEGTLRDLEEKIGFLAKHRADERTHEEIFRLAADITREKPLSFSAKVKAEKIMEIVKNLHKRGED